MSAEANNNKRPSRKDYRRVVRKDTENTEKGKSAPNEIRVTASRGQRFYISYALDLFNGANDKPKSDTVILSGMGEAIYNVVNIAEVVKRRVKGLHQTCDIGSQTMSDEYEPLKDKEGLEKIVVQRKVSTITIVLSTKQLDTAHIGYQAPLPESEVKEGPPERKPREEGEERPRRGGRDRRPRGDDEKPARGGDDSRRGGRRGGDNNDRPRGGRGASRGGRDDRPREDRPRRDDRPREDRPPRRDDREDRTRGGSRGGRDDRPREDRPPRRDDREDRPRGGRGGPRRDDRDFRDAPARGGNRGPRDDRPPRRDDREDRPRGDRGAPRGGNGGGRGGERAARGAPRGGYGGERRDGGRGGQAPRR